MSLGNLRTSLALSVSLVMLSAAGAHVETLAFENVMNIGSDSHGEGALFVTDLRNDRVHVFDRHGKPLRPSVTDRKRAHCSVSHVRSIQLSRRRT